LGIQEGYRVYNQGWGAAPKKGLEQDSQKLCSSYTGSWETKIIGAKRK